MRNNTLLACNGITKNFGGLTALNDVSFEVSENEILALIGPNGAGKTTLFNIIAGLHRPTNGNIVFNDINITGLYPSKICRLGIARTFQIPQPFKGLTTIENVYIGYNFGNVKKKDKKFVLDILNFLNIYEDKDKLIENLTVEKQKRIEIARALATNPTLLLLDEVAAGLNQKEQDELNHVILNIQAELGITIILIEHIMRMVMKISDRIVVLNQGNLLIDDSPKKVANNPNVIKAYLGEEYVDNTES